MQFDLTINSVSKPLRSGSLSINRTMNGRATASFAIMSADQSYRPPLNATVEIDVEGTTIFGGLITVPREKGLFGGVKPNIVTQVTAADYNVYADRRYALEDLPAGTLKAALQVLLPYLTAYGVTLDVGQVDGPTLPALIWTYKRVSDCLNELMTLTAEFGPQYAWQISETKVLSAFQPSSVPAPFDLIADGTGAVQKVIGDIEVEQNLENFSNKIIIKVPPRTETDRQESFVGDGVTSTVTLQYTVLKHYGHILVGDPPGSGGGETWGIPPDTPLQWSFDPVTNQMTRLIGPLALGETYTLQFDGTYEVTAFAEDAASIAALGIFERVIQVEEIPEGSTAQSMADAYLAMYLVIHHLIRYKTLQHGLAPGQIQTITVPARDLSGTAIITAVNLREFGPARVQYDVEATLSDDTNVLRAFQDLYKLWRGDLTGTGGGSSTISPGTGTITNAGPAPPFWSNQFNRAGAFGGSVSWLFVEDYTTVTLGSGHVPQGSNNLLVGQGHTVL